jgi:hypothetical protein
MKTEYLSTQPSFDWGKFCSETIVPGFEIEIPSSWAYKRSLLEYQMGSWLSWLGPLDVTGIRHIGVDVCLVERGNLPHQASLQEYVKYTCEQERIGIQLMFLCREQNVSGILSPEIKLHLRRTFAGQAGLVQLTLVKQWVVVPYQNYFVTIMFESPEKEYDHYVCVYNRVVQSWKFVSPL